MAVTSMPPGTAGLTMRSVTVSGERRPKRIGFKPTENLLAMSRDCPTDTAVTMLRERLYRSCSTWERSTGQKGNAGVVLAVTNDGLAYQTSYDVGLADLIAGSWIRRRMRAGAPTLSLVPGGLSDSQRAAAALVLAEPVSALVGIPGTGKTYVTEQIGISLRRHGLNYAGVSFCGSAASRLSDCIGSEAKTCHRFLGYNGSEFEFSEHNKIEGLDCLIIDEAGQLPSGLHASLIRALPDDCRVIYIGDTNQLPSIEPGGVLSDITKTVPTGRLFEVRRTNPQGPIGLALLSMLSGKLPESAENKGDGFYYWPTCDDSLSERSHYAHTRMSEIHGVNFESIRMLAPVNEVVEKYNNYCMGRFSGRIPIIARKNVYQDGYFNGDTGYLTANSVSINGSIVPFNRAIHHLGFSSTTYVAQGHEFIASGYMLPQFGAGRPKFEEIFTAITRARNRFIVLGCMGAFQKALKRRETKQRISLLSHFITGNATVLQ